MRHLCANPSTLRILQARCAYKCMVHAQMLNSSLSDVKNTWDHQCVALVVEPHLLAHAP